MDLNRVTILGRLTRDPEQKSTKTGKTICNFSIANNESKERVGFYDCIAWEKTGQLVKDYFRKGSRILIDGKLEHSTWENDKGEKRSAVRILVNSISFIDKKSDGGWNESPAPPMGAQVDDSEIPF